MNNNACDNYEQKLKEYLKESIHVFGIVGVLKELSIFMEDNTNSNVKDPIKDNSELTKQLIIFGKTASAIISDAESKIKKELEISNILKLTSEHFGKLLKD